MCFCEVLMATRNTHACYVCRKLAVFYSELEHQRKGNNLREIAYYLIWKYVIVKIIIIAENANFSIFNLIKGMPRLVAALNSTSLHGEGTIYMDME